MNFGTMSASCPLSLSNFGMFNRGMSRRTPQYRGVFLRLHGAVASGRGLLTTVLCSGKALERANVCSVIRRMSHINTKSTFMNNVVCNLLACPSGSRGALRFTLTTSTLGGAVCKSFGRMAMRRIRRLVRKGASKEMIEWLFSQL